MRRRQLATGLTLAMVPVIAHAAARSTRLVAERFAKTLSDHDIAAFAALFAEDYQQHQTSAAAPPPPSGVSAKQATVAYFAARLAALPDLAVTADPVVAGEDSVAANFTYTGMHLGPYFGVPPTGKRITFTSCDIFTIRDGLIAAHWGAADIAGLMRQLGG